MLGDKHIEDFNLLSSDNGIPIIPSIGHVVIIGNGTYFVYDILWILYEKRVIVYAIQIGRKNNGSIDRPHQLATEAGWIPA